MKVKKVKKINNGIPALGWTACAMVVLMAAAAPAGDAQVITALSTPASTRPSEEAKLSFIHAGRVGQILVKDGQAVQAGDVLIRLDDTADPQTVEELKAEAENTTKVAAAQAEMEQKQAYLDELQEPYKRGSATKWELKNAELDVTIAQLRLSLANFEHQQSQLAYQSRVNRMELKSPITGRVERVVIHVGESADPQEKIAYVVNIDPLWVDAPIPLEQARRLKLDQTVEVVFPEEGVPPAKGKIILVASVADSASQTLNVRVEVPNPTHRPAGEHVQIRLPSQ
jgi:RND family efflux transporter MFP subunit